MKIKEEIINALEALSPKIDKNKAELELSVSTKALTNILSESNGLDLIEYICAELEYGRSPIYTTNMFLEEPQISQLIEYLYRHNEQEVLDTLLLWYHEIWMNNENDDPKKTFEVLKKLEESNAIESSSFITTICIDCYSIARENHNICRACGSNNLLEIYEISLSKTTRSILKNGQYLEIYVKECMKESGIEPIGWKTRDGKKVYTSIEYQIEGEYIDVDVLGISRPVAVLLCEAKTSKKITMNEVRRVENLFDRLIKKINKLTGRDIQCLKLFITTGKFDRNIPAKSYQRKGWELIDRSKISNLVEEFRRIVDEI